MAEGTENEKHKTDRLIKTAKKYSKSDFSISFYGFLSNQTDKKDNSISRIGYSRISSCRRRRTFCPFFFLLDIHEIAVCMCVIFAFRVGFLTAAFSWCPRVGIIIISGFYVLWPTLYYEITVVAQENLEYA